MTALPQPLRDADVLAEHWAGERRILEEGNAAVPVIPARYVVTEAGRGALAQADGADLDDEPVTFEPRRPSLHIALAAAALSRQQGRTPCDVCGRPAVVLVHTTDAKVIGPTAHPAYGSFRSFRCGADAWPVLDEWERAGVRYGFDGLASAIGLEEMTALKARVDQLQTDLYGLAGPVPV